MSYEPNNLSRTIRGDTRTNAERSDCPIDADLSQLVDGVLCNDKKFLGNTRVAEVFLLDLGVTNAGNKPADVHLIEDLTNDARHFCVRKETQLPSADHVDVALVELAITPRLLPLTPPNLLHLVAAEWKHQLVLILRDIVGERNCEVEMKCHVRLRPFDETADNLQHLHIVAILFLELELL